MKTYELVCQLNKHHVFVIVNLLRSFKIVNMLKFHLKLMLLLVLIFSFCYCVYMLFKLPARTNIKVAVARDQDRWGVGNNVAEVSPPVVDRAQSQYNGLKKILYWNDAYGDPNFNFGAGQEPFVEAGCGVQTCYATHDRDLFPLEEIDALLWHIRAKDLSLPDKRYANTYYIFWMKESALYIYNDLRNFDRTFNWTMTYRTDSDYPIPSGRTVARRNKLPPGDTNFAAGKTKLAAWFVSNCRTAGGRENLMQSLSSRIRLSIYGACGTLECPRADESRCYRMLEENYKFYFSFENSLCRDYATEKLFNVLQYNVVPVTYGLGYENLGLPPHSYIDVMDFPSVDALAEYLLYLDRNDTAYNEYFRWKSEYTVDVASVESEQFCKLCERLHYPDRNEDVLRQRSARVSSMRQRVAEIEKNTKIKMPAVEDKSHLIQVLPNGGQVYQNLYLWFEKNECVNQFTNRDLARFVHGWSNSDSAKMSRDRNDALQSQRQALPYLVEEHL